MVASSFRSAALLGFLMCTSGSWAFIAKPRCLSGSSTNLFVGNENKDFHVSPSVDAEPRTTEFFTDSSRLAKFITRSVAGMMILSSTVAPLAAFADGQTKEFRLPPIDYADKSRCQLKSSSIGQANAARDKLYDLRLCELSGADASGFDLSGVIM